jgi:hypothetical protein
MPGHQAKKKNISSGRKNSKNCVHILFQHLVPLCFFPPLHSANAEQQHLKMPDYITS